MEMLSAECVVEEENSAPVISHTFQRMKKKKIEGKISVMDERERMKRRHMHINIHTHSFTLPIERR